MRKGAALENSATVRERLNTILDCVQSSVPGVYAWAVTVAPVGLACGSGAAAKTLAVIALVALAAGALGAGRLFPCGRTTSLGGFVVSAGLTWAVSPAPFGTWHIDAVGALSGMLGWGLYAWGYSARPLAPVRLHRLGSVAEGNPTELRRSRPFNTRGKVACVACTAALVELISTECLGWPLRSPERAVLLRFVTLAAGLAVVTVSTRVALVAQPRLELGDASKSPADGTPVALAAQGPTPARTAYRHDRPTVLDFVWLPLMLGASTAFSAGELALARTEDVRAVVCLAVGIASTRVAVILSRPGGRG